MQCPVCKVPMKKGNRAGVALEFCSDCGGAWLDLFHLDLMLYRTKPNADQEQDTDGSDLEVAARGEPRRR